MNITLNNEQRLFVLDHGSGYTCHGYEVVARELGALLHRFAQLAFLQAKALATHVGTLDQYAVYREALDYLACRKIQSHTWFHPDTPATVTHLLELYRLNRKRLRVFYGDASTGRDWMCESDMLGRVGRSSGTLRIPLLIDDGECGGPGLLDHCIVRLIDVATRRELYRHPGYHQPVMTIEPDGTPGYSHAVLFDGKLQARFSSCIEASTWVTFMSGNLMEMPA